MTIQHYDSGLKLHNVELLLSDCTPQEIRTGDETTIQLKPTPTVNAWYDKITDYNEQHNINNPATYIITEAGQKDYKICAGIGGIGKYIYT